MRRWWRCCYASLPDFVQCFMFGVVISTSHASHSIGSGTLLLFSSWVLLCIGVCEKWRIVRVRFVCFRKFERTCTRLSCIVVRLMLRVLLMVYPPYRYTPCHSLSEFPFMRVCGRARRVNRLRVMLITFVVTLFRGFGGSRPTAARLENRSTRGASRRKYRGASRGEYRGTNRGEYRGDCADRPIDGIA